jgi:hypothetical protein
MWLENAISSWSYMTFMQLISAAPYLWQPLSIRFGELFFWMFAIYMMMNGYLLFC